MDPARMDLAKIEQLAVDDVQVVADGDGLAAVTTPGVVTVPGGDRHSHCGPPLCGPVHTHAAPVRVGHQDPPPCGPVHTHAAPVRVRPADPVPGT